MLKRTLVFCFIIFTAFAAHAEEERYVEGVHYTTLVTPLKTSFRGEEIGEIMEFFSYGCIHCYNFEPSVERFMSEKPENIRFSAIPVMFNERQAPEVRAYYVIQTLKLGSEAHAAVFKAIHKDRKSLRTDAQFAKFFETLGVSKDKYMATAYSFGVDPLVKRSIYLTGNSGISGTPSIMANGKYLIDSGAVGGNEMALYVAKWLVERDAAIEN
jgi:thiol:disulfide interchange protein DsbA